MKYSLALVLAALSLAACKKSPDAPPPAVASITTTTNPNPPVSNCQGATVPWSLPSGETINSNSSRVFSIPGFDLGCGDSVRVYIRGNSGQAWYELFTVNQGASYYSLSGTNVTVFNMTGIVQEVAIEAVLK